MTKSASESTEGATQGELTASDRYRLLSSPRRRATLDALATRSTPVALEDLATAVAAREADGDDPDAGSIDRVAASLHHAHLPKLDEAGVVEYDAEANRIERATALRTD